MTTTLTLPAYERRVDSHLEWGEGDLTLVSSDRVQFLLPSHLVCTSAIFLAAISVPDANGTVVLTHADDRSRVVNAWLYVLSGRGLPGFHHRPPADLRPPFRALLPDLARFIVRHACADGRRLLSRMVTRKLRRGRVSLADAFRVAQIFEDVKLRRLVGRISRQRA